VLKALKVLQALKVQLVVQGLKVFREPPVLKVLRVQLVVQGLKVFKAMSVPQARLEPMVQRYCTEQLPQLTSRVLMVITT
jgi:hypothetical protein